MRTFIPLSLLALALAGCSGLPLFQPEPHTLSFFISPTLDGKGFDINQKPKIKLIANFDGFSLGHPVHTALGTYDNPPQKVAIEVAGIQPRAHVCYYRNHTCVSHGAASRFGDYTFTLGADELRGKKTVVLAAWSSDNKRPLYCIKGNKQFTPPCVVVYASSKTSKKDLEEEQATMFGH